MNSVDRDKQYEIEYETTQVREFLINLKPNKSSNMMLYKDKRNEEAFFTFTVFGLKKSGKSSLLNTLVASLLPPDKPVQNWYQARVTKRENLEGEGTVKFKSIDFSEEIPSSRIQFYDTRGFAGNYESEIKELDQISRGKVKDNSTLKMVKTQSFLGWIFGKNPAYEIDKASTQTATINSLTHCIFFVIDGTKEIPLGFDKLVNMAVANKTPFLFVITHLDENKTKCEAMKDKIKHMYGSYEAPEVWLKSQIFLQHNYVITEGGYPKRSAEIDHSALKILQVACLKANDFLKKNAIPKFEEAANGGCMIM